MNKRGSYHWKISTFSGGQDSYHSASEIPEVAHAVIRNFWTDGETLKLRGGATAIPTPNIGSIGAVATSGAKGLYIWRPDDATRKIVAAYPRASSADRLSLYFVSTGSVVTLGGEFYTAPRVAMAGFGNRLYASEGKTRLKYTDGSGTAEAEAIDSPSVVASPYTYLPPWGWRRVWYSLQGISGTAPHATKYPENPVAASLWRFPLNRWGDIGVGKTAWAGSAPGGRLGVEVVTGLSPPSGGPQDEWAMRIIGTASLTAGSRAYYSIGSGGTTTVGGVHFWAKSTRLGEYLKLELSGGGTVRMRDNPILFNQTGRWEFKQYFFDSLPRLERTNIGSARIVVTDSNETFTAQFSNMYFDGLQQGDYEVAAALYDSAKNIESPLGDIYDLRANRGPYLFSAFSFPGIKTKDQRVDTVRWYRRGGASPQWRMVAEVPTATQAWDFLADIDTGNISVNEAPPAPRAKYLAPIGYSRMLALGGLDQGDYIPGIPTGITMLATNSFTAMNRVGVGGMSKGVEFYAYTSQATYNDGTFALLLKEGATVKRRTVFNAKSIMINRWNTILWTGGYQIAQGSGANTLCFSGMANCNFRMGSYTSGKKASYYHLLEYPRRIWYSREGKVDSFDRYTRLSAADTDGFWYDLPGAGSEAISGHGRHGSDDLIFTEAQTFIDSGDSASDISTVRIHSGIGAVNDEVVAEFGDHTAWVSGHKGTLKVYAFGPKLETPVWVPSHEKGGFNDIGLAIEPLLNLIADPTKMSATLGKGLYHLFFGEAVSYSGDKYTGASFNPASGGWVTHYQSSTRTKVPRFAVTDPQTGNVLLASPANSTAGTGTNKVWTFDDPNLQIDGSEPIEYIYETRHQGLPQQSVTKLRGYSVYCEQATAGPLSVVAYARGATAGTIVEGLGAVGAGPITLEHRFGPRAQGAYVGMRFSGTSSTDITVRSVSLYLDAKR